MSTLKVDGIRSNSASSDAITLASDGTCTANITNRSNRNLIINGAMQVAQRGTVTGITNQKYGGPDRYETHISGLGTWTTSQTSSSADQNTTGFLNSLKMQCTTAKASPDANNFMALLQHVEGYNATQLQWGTANAKPVTLSFWCKANISGWSSGTKSFISELQAGTTTVESGQLVTLNTNDTWQKITLTFPAQTSQALNTTNSSGISVNFWLDAGSTWKSGTLSSSWSDKANSDRAPGLTLNLGSNTANYFQITGIQLEAGSVATDFEHRSYGQELQLCKRYYEVFNPSTYVLGRYSAGTTGDAYNFHTFEVEKRTNPTASASGTFTSSGGYAGDPEFTNIDSRGAGIYSTNTISSGGILYLDDSGSAFCKFDAEI